MSFYINEKINENAYITHGMSGSCCYQVWFCDINYSICHRLDGPAVVRSELALPNDEVDTYQEWWYYGTKIECSSQEEFEKIIKLKAFW